MIENLVEEGIYNFHGTDNHVTAHDLNITKKLISSKSKDTHVTLTYHFEKNIFVIQYFLSSTESPYKVATYKDSKELENVLKEDSDKNLFALHILYGKPLLDLFHQYEKLFNFRQLEKSFKKIKNQKLQKIDEEYGK